MSDAYTTVLRMTAEDLDAQDAYWDQVERDASEKAAAEWEQEGIDPQEEDTDHD